MSGGGFFFLPAVLVTVTEEKEKALFLFGNRRSMNKERRAQLQKNFQQEAEC